MAKRRYFTKAVPPAPPVPRSPAWERPVQGIAPDGRSRVYDARWVRQMLGRSKGGKAVHAKRKANKFDSETGRKAANRRWVGTARKPAYNRVMRGIRIGLRYKRRKPLDYAELRMRYAEPRSDWRVRYDPDARQWWVRDDLGERTCSERVAMQYAGHLKRPTIMARIPKQFRGIDLDKEGWNRD